MAEELEQIQEENIQPTQAQDVQMEQVEQVAETKEPTQEPPSKASQLYNQLLKEGYTEKNLYGGEQNFINKVSTKEGASKLFAQLKSEGYTDKNLYGGENNFINNLVSQPPVQKKSPLYTAQGFIQQKTEQEKKQPLPVKPSPKKPATFEESVTKDKEEKGSRLGYIYNGIMSGIGKLGSAASDITMQILTKVLPDEAVGGTGTSAQNREAALKQWREQVEPDIRKATEKLAGVEVSEKNKEKYDNEFFTSSVRGLAESAPMMLGFKGSGLLLGGFDAGLESINNTKIGDKLPESTKTIFAFGVGTANAALEKIGIDKIFGKQSKKVATNLAVRTMSDLVSKSAVPITTEVFEKALTANANNIKNKILKAGGKIGEAGITEFLTGATQEGVNILGEEILNKSQKQQVFEPTDFGQKINRVLYAGAQESVGGGIMGGLSLPFSKTRNYISEKVSEAKTPEDINNLKNEIATQAQKQNLSKNEFDATINLVDQYAKIHSSIPETVANKTKVAEKIIERDELQDKAAQVLNEAQNLDPAFQEQKIEEAKLLTKKADEIHNRISGKPVYKIGEQTVDRDTFNNYLDSSAAKKGDVELYVEQDDEMSAKLEKLGGVTSIDEELDIPFTTNKKEAVVSTKEIEDIENNKKLDLQELQDKLNNREIDITEHEKQVKDVIDYYDNLKKQYDTKNITGLPSKVGGGEELIQAEPVQGGGTQEISGGGVLQENVPSRQGEVAETTQGEIEKLRAEEQAEYAAMANPKDKAKRQEIYDKYDKLITPLLVKDTAKKLESLDKSEYNKKLSSFGDAKRVADIYYNPSKYNFTKGQHNALVKTIDDLIGKQKENVPTTGKKVSGTVQPTTEVPKGQKAKTGVQPSAEPVSGRGTEASATVLTPKEGDAVELPSQVKGGIPRTMVFNEGEWKQQVGGKPVGVGENVRQQAQTAFQKTTPVAEVPVPKTKTEQVGEGLLSYLGIPVEPKKTKGKKAVNINNKSELAQLESSTQGEKKTIVQAAKKAIATLKSVFPDMEIYIHEDADSYNETMREEVGGVQNSRGNFAFERDANGNPTGKGRIDINLSNAKDTTVAHELTHAVLLKAFGDNPALFKTFRDRMSKILREDLNKEVTEFENLYSGQAVAPEEYLTELSALLSRGGETVQYKPSTLRKIAALINEYVSRITGGKLQPFKSEADFKNFVDFLNQIAGAIREGDVIKGLNTQEAYSNGASIPVSNPESFVAKKVTEPVKSKSQIGDYKFPDNIEILKTADLPVKNLTDLVRQYEGKVVIITSDATGYGVDKNGDPIFGGFGFSANAKNVNDGIGFASVSIGTVKGTYTAAEKAYGQGKTLVLVMIQPPHTTINNSYGSKYIIRGIKEIASQSKEELAKTKEAIKDFIKNSTAIQNELKTNEASLKRGSEKRLIELIDSINENTDLDEATEEFIADTTFTIRKELGKGIILENKDIRTNKSTNYAKIALNNAGYNIFEFLKEYGDNTFLNDDIILNNTGGFVVGGFELDILPTEQREKLISDTQSKGIVHPLFNAKLPGANHFILDGLYDVQENFAEYVRPETTITLDQAERDKLVRKYYKEDRFYKAEYRSIPLRKRTYTQLTIPAKTEFKEKYLRKKGYLVETVPNIGTKVAKGEGFIPKPGAAEQMAKATYVSKSQKDAVDEKLNKAVDYKKESGTTQVATTTGSYEKAANILKEMGIDSDVLDYGAGLGLGSDAMSKVLGFNVDSFEPNSERWKGNKEVTFKSSSDINKKYNSIVSLNVLNVVEKDIRDSIVKDIYNNLKDGGTAVISTRKWSGDVNQAKNAVDGGEKNSLYITRTQGGKEVKVFQKGFDGNELVDYIKDLLGDRVTVQKNNSFGAAGVVIKKVGEGMTSKSQVEAYHGSPYDFEKFTTEKIGTGEGAQAFGHGLYFTDLKSIAKHYADALSSRAIQAEGIAQFIYGTGYTNENVKEIVSKSAEERIKAINDVYNKKVNKIKSSLNYEQFPPYGEQKIETLTNLKNRYINDAKENIKKTVYQVTLHEGKTPSEYIWMEWDNPFKEKYRNEVLKKFLDKKNISNKEFNELKKDGIQYADYDDSIDIFKEVGISNLDGFAIQSLLDNESTGRIIYDNLQRAFNNSPKTTSEFLLNSGVDGIKYPAESISRGTTSETARGFNYVVFDENAVTIKSKSQKPQIKDYIESQRKAGVSDEDIRAGIESVADRVGLTKDDIDSLMAGEVKAEVPVQENPFEKVPKTQAARTKYFESTFGENAARAEEIYNKYKDTNDFESMQKEMQGEEVKGKPEIETVGITKKDIKELAAKYNLEIDDRREAISDIEIERMAKELIANGYDVDGLVREALDTEKRPLTDIEANILAEVAADMKAKIDVNSSDADIQKYRDVLSALNKGISENARGLRMAKVKKNVVESIADVMANMMEDNLVDELTTEQREEAEKRFNEIKEALDKETELRKQAEAEIDKLKAELKIEQEKNKSKDKPKKAPQEFKVEKESIIKSIKDKWQSIISGTKPSKMKSKSQASGQMLDQLMAIAPEINKLIKGYIENGIATTLEDVKAQLKKDIEDAGITLADEDLNELVAGNYNKKKKDSKRELNRKLYELKQEQKLLLEIEKLEAGEVPTTEKKKIQKNQKIAALRKKIKELTGKELPKKEKKEKKEKTEDDKFAQYINTRIKANEKRQSEIQEKIDNEDYEPEEKKESILENTELQKRNRALYDKYLDSVLNKDEKLLEYEKKRVADKMKNRGKLEKLAGGIDVALTTAKGTVAMFDQSVYLVQMLPFTLSHPYEAAKYAVQSLKYFADKTAFDKTMATLHSTELWNLIEKSGLVIYEPRSAKADLRNELYGGEKNLWNKEVEFKGKKYSIGQAFERSTTSALNNARIYLFMTQVQDLYNAGKTFKNSPKDFEAAARAVNELTGHGKLAAPAQMVSKFLGSFIWSAKMFASTLNLSGLGDLVRPVATANAIARKFGIKTKESEKYTNKGFYTSLTPEQGKFVAKEMARFIGTGIMVMLAIKLASIVRGDDEDEVEIDVNPTSSGFGSIKTGDKTFVVYGRFASAVRTVVQALSGKKTVKGEEQDLGEGYGSKTSGEVVFGSFVRGKATPAAGLAYDFFLNNRKNYYTKEELTPSTVGKQMLVPMAAQDMAKDFDRDGFLLGAAETVAKLYGANIRDDRDFMKEEEKVFTEEDMTKNAMQMLKEYSVEVPKFGTIEKNKIEVDKNHPEAGQYKNGTPYALFTPEEFEKYNNYRKDYIIKGLKVLYRLNKSGDIKLTKQKLEERLTSLKSQASKIAKMKIPSLIEKNKEKADEDITIDEEFKELFSEENPNQ
jgi:hypothetical protein